jgi:hypothetical protein
MGGPLDGNPQVGTGDIFVNKFSSSGVRQYLEGPLMKDEMKKDPL